MSTLTGSSSFLAEPAPPGVVLGETAARPATKLGAIWAMMRSDARQRSVFRFALALDFVFGILNLVVFQFISHLLRRTPNAGLGAAHSYFSFVAIGIAFMLVVQAATAGLMQRVRDEKISGTLETLATEPLTPAQLAIGMAGFPYLFATARAAGYIAVAALALGLNLSHANYVGAMLLLLAAEGALMAVGIALSAFALVFRQATSVGRVVVFGLGFLGGTYFPVHELPRWIQPLSAVTPTRVALDGLRNALYSGDHWASSLALLVGFSAVAFPVSIVMFRSALRISMRRGALSRS